MLDFEVRGKKFQITFSFPDKHKTFRRITNIKLSVKIENPENPEDYAWETIDVSYSKCNVWEDTFDKNRGRFQALTNLMKSVLVRNIFSKEDRKKIWEIYFSKYGFPPKIIDTSTRNLWKLFDNRKLAR